MDRRIMSESLLLPGCALLLLTVLCTPARAGGMGRAGGDNSASVRLVTSTESTEEGKKSPPENTSVPVTPSEEKKAPGRLPDEAPDAFPKELADPSDATVREAQEPPLPKDRWIDVPGNDLKLAAYIAGGLAVAPLAGGIVLLVQNSHATCSKSVPVPCGTGYVWAGVSFGAAGLLLVSALAFGLAGNTRAEEEQMASRHSGFEPFLSPMLEKKNDNVSMTGAVIGLRGSF